MKHEITAISVLVINDNNGAKTTLEEVKFNLDIPPTLDQKYYLDEEGLPNKDGAKALSNAFVQGLLGNIHSQHQQGHWDSAEHLRWIIAELERGFVHNTEIKKGYF